MFVSPMARDDDGSLRRWVTILFAAVMCLLLIVCSNVAGLLLVRSSERQFELSVRLALGASGFRIARQLLTEVLMLSIGGGVVGYFWRGRAYRGCPNMDRPVSCESKLPCSGSAPCWRF